MAQLTGASITKALGALFSSLDTTDEALIRKLFLRKKVIAPLFDAATAGTAMTETTIYENDSGVDMKVVGVKVVAPIAVAADNTDYVTFTVTKRTAAGASNVTVATADTRAASLNALAAFIWESLTLTDANVVVPDGSCLSVAVAKAGSGKAITAATSHAYVEVLLEPNF